MPEILKLPVFYKGEEHQFDIEMINWTYTHRFKVHVEDAVYLFEPDEEGQYRAISETVVPWQQDRLNLLREIGQTLSQLMNPSLNPPG